jgi:hypothetical protein
MTSLAETLEPWCVAGATGVLRITGSPGGAIHLLRGRITYAESPLACGVNRMLTASGRMGVDTLRGALASGRTGDLAVELTRPGLLAPVEMEAMFLAATYSAGHFLFDAVGDARFELGLRHQLAGVVELDLDAVRIEIDRRRAALRAAWPYDHVDVVTVTPVRRIDGQHAALTALQWEIVVNSGRRRTPIDLAKLLGRDTYATLLGVRRMVASGLIQAPAPVAPPVPARRTRNVGSSDIAASPRPRSMASSKVAVAGVLPRRNPQAPATTGTPTGDDWSDLEWTDLELCRIRDALQALR